MSEVQKGDLVYHDGQTPYRVVDVLDDGRVSVTELTNVDGELVPRYDEEQVATYSPDLYRDRFSTERNPALAGAESDPGGDVSEPEAEPEPEAPAEPAAE